MKSKQKCKKSSRKSQEVKLSVALPSCSQKGRVAPSPPEHVTKKRKLYCKDALRAAYKAVKDSSISVNAAAKQYGVPLTTLRDRVDGRISIETTRPGPPLLMARDEESEIAHFLHTMARYGYRYTRLELAEIATDQAVEKGKRNPRANGLTTKWVDSFVNRWPGIRELSCKFKNKADAEHTVRTYFDEIKKIIDRHRLLEKHDRIFNIIEITLTTDHGSAFPVSLKSNHQFKTENISTTTVIACGGVSGQVVAPFLVFQASKLRPDMMKGVPSNVNASVSDTGRCTPHIFRRYLKEHFLPQIQRYEDEAILVLMDGSKSHIFVGLSEWGRSHNVIFSFIPAHTTHLLQPLEVDCMEELRKKYESVCRRYLKSSSLTSVSRNNIGELAWQAYARVMTTQAVVHSFRKAGVYPDISSDESCDEADENDDNSYKGDFNKTDDSSEVHEEVIFTEDLVVGQNQEVTEEEVVTSQEVVLSDDGDTDQVEDGQFLLANTQMMVAPPSHMVIHEGEIFVNSSEAGFSHFQTIQLMEELEDTCSTKLDISISPLKQCILNDGKMLDSCPVDMDTDHSLNDSCMLSLNCCVSSAEQTSVESQSSYSSLGELDLKPGGQTQIGGSDCDSLSVCSQGPCSPGTVYIVKQELEEETGGHQVLLQTVLDIVGGK